VNITETQLRALEADGWRVAASVWTAAGNQCLLRRGEEEKMVTVTDAPEPEELSTGDAWVVHAKYSSGTYRARNRETGKACSCTESERGAVVGLARKITQGSPEPEVRQICTGIWIVATKPAAPCRGGAR
jgi:hypothetical protein